MKFNKIGIFDSGIGGLSILKELLKVLPNEDYLFYEDSINNPYGAKSDDELFEITSSIVDYLIDNECKIIVIACNTATTSCMKRLRDKYTNVIFVGTVPAIKVAYDNNYKNTVVLATPYTVKSSRVQELISSYKNDDQNIYVVSGQDLAHLVDIGDNIGINNLLEEILTPYNGIADSVVLGCTHYPLIAEQIKKVLPDCKIIDGSIGVANEVKKQLEINNLLNDATNVSNIEIINSKSDELIERSYEILNDLDTYN